LIGLARSPSAAGIAAEENVSIENPALTDRSFARGAAETSPAERTGMTAGGTYAKTFLLLVLLVAAAAFGWSQVEIVHVGSQAIPIQPWWTWLAFLATFILAFAGVFAYRSIPIISVLYALSEGALLGIASRYFNLETQGIVLLAVLATIGVFAATLFLYSTGVLRATPGLAMGVSIALGGLMILWLTAWLFSLFGVNFSFWNAPTPFGILLSLGIVVLGALTLPLDFAFIQRASAAGAPKWMEWYGAYGLMLSLIWMYVSILRLLAILSRARS
jgi:uncharacterized YccA/Bax inhibitor family protein